MARIDLPDKWRDEDVREEVLVTGDIETVAWWLLMIVEQELRGEVSITARHMARRDNGRS